MSCSNVKKKKSSVVFRLIARCL